jgi:hypothetical protein
LREERNLETNELLRDSFKHDELTLVDEAETIVTALLMLGFTYDEVKVKLMERFQKLIK